MKRQPFVIGSSLVLLLTGSLRSASADRQMDALIAEVDRATRAIRTLSAKAVTERPFQGKRRTTLEALKIQRPNLCQARSLLNGGYQTLSDGKNVYSISPNRHYQQHPIAPDGSNSAGGPFVECFFSGLKASIGASREGSHLTYAGRETRARIAYRVLALDVPKEHTRVRFYIHPRKLLAGVVLERTGPHAFRISQFLTDIQINKPIPAREFAFQPTADMKLVNPERYDEKLLAVGAEAPAFELTNPIDGKRFSLAALVRGKRATLINFWFYG